MNLIACIHKIKCKQTTQTKSFFRTLVLEPEMIYNKIAFINGHHTKQISWIKVIIFKGIKENKDPEKCKQNFENHFNHEILKNMENYIS